MKTTMFVGAQMHIGDVVEYEYIKSLRVPTLSAYAVEHAEFSLRSLDAGLVQAHSGADFDILGDEIQLQSGFSDKFGALASCRLVIHYHGIRDYEALFPQITDASLKARLGQFYQEAEATFETNSWLAFVLMSVAIYEGLLASRLGVTDGKLANLIDRALGQKLISANEAKILHNAREHRNLVHAARHSTPYVQRAEAMDMRTILDGLIRRLSNANPLP